MLPLPQLATCPDPADQYAELRARGVHDRDGVWVVARPDHVAAALASPALGVAPGGSLPAAAPDGTAAQLQARMARFTDGPEHARRRALVEGLLPDPGALERDAAKRASELADTTTSVLDAMPVARTVPVAALAAALGVAEVDVPWVVTMTGRLCDGLAPTLDTRPPAPARSEVDAAAWLLLTMVPPFGPDAGVDDDAAVAAASLLFQARDATAALIGAALLTSADDDDDDVVERALRLQPPVPATRRTARADVELGGVTVPRGATVWVTLAAAECGPPAPAATFGSGRHGCPGAAAAVALARGVVAGIRAAGWRPVPGQGISYEPRPNLRLPTQVLLQRR